MRIFHILSVTGTVILGSVVTGGAETHQTVYLGPNDLFGPHGINRRILETRLSVPRGYKRAWNDGRLNPLSGAGTLNGERQMNSVWTNTVPRKTLDTPKGPRRKIR